MNKFGHLTEKARHHEKLEGRVAVVIGSGRGIGAAIASRLVRDGAFVVVADRDIDLANNTVASFDAGERAIAAQADIRDIAAADRLVALAVEKFGQLDILVQNAGIFPWSLIEEISVDEWDSVLETNLRGAFLSARAALPHLRNSAYGRLIFTSSITGPRVSSPGHAHYAASKAGINGLVKSAAIEFSSYGITVNAVEPGNILTEGMKAERTAQFIENMTAAVPLGRLGAPDDVANAVSFLASDEASYITGTSIIVDGGQILPEMKTAKG